MEILPVPQANTPDTPHSPEAATEEPQKLPTQPEKPPTVPPPLRYDLNISPNLTATIELNEVPESYFEQRTESLNHANQTQQTTQGMIPLSQVLAAHPTNQSSKTTATPSTQPAGLPDVGLPKQIFAAPIYKRAVLGGLLGGIVLVAILLLIFER